MNPTGDRPGGWLPNSGGGTKDPQKRPSSTIRTQGPATTPESTNNQHSLSDINPVDPSSTPSGSQSVTVHNFTRPDIKLQVNDVIFILRESQVSRFAALQRLIEDSRRTKLENDTPVIIVNGVSQLAPDFLNTFELLNTSCVETVNFSPDVLVSAARISAAYDYPELRTFSIKQLEVLSLGPIERLLIGRALNLKSWEERACQELSERDEALTREEMLSLGTDAYFQVVNMRERRQSDQINKLSSDLKSKMTPLGAFHGYIPEQEPGDRDYDDGHSYDYGYDHDHDHDYDYDYDYDYDGVY